MKALDYAYLLWSLLLLTACGSDTPIEPIDPPIDPPTSGLKEGFNYSSEAPDADAALTVTFKAPSSSQLYGYTGEVYLHTGVIVEGTWMFVPFDWNTNNAKCKMSKVEANVWKIDLSPSVRNWYNSGETAVTQLGFVIRSADGTKKGQSADAFVTVTDSKYKAFVPAAIKNAALPAGVKPGINVVDNSTVTLVLYDKDKAGAHKDYAHVVGDFNNWKLTNEANCQMNRDETSGCWWITLTGLSATKEYAFQYYVGTKAEGSIRLADAYARKVLDPNNDTYISASTYPDSKDYPKGAIGVTSVFRIQAESYAWKVADYRIADKKDLVIYELLLRDFTASKDINGAMTKLDYLKSLGVNAIELMPVQEFDGNDSWGYNPCFFFALDKAYGTDRMYKEFIDACHARGMAVIFDVVFNHATGAHPFAKLYWDGAKNATAANNPWFNVSAPHPYSVFHDFNHESPLVRDFFVRNLRFLLDEYHVDGFRFDLTKGFTQKNSSESTASAYDASRIANLKVYNAAVKTQNPNAVVILEHFCDSKEENELADDGMFMWRNLNYAYCESAMGWPDKADFSALYEQRGNWVGFMESHDEERTAFKQKTYGNYDFKSNNTSRMKQQQVNTAFFLTVPGPKMIWQFGEMGYDISIEENGRTGAKPLKWEYLDEAARKALHTTYTKLMDLRKRNSELFSVNATFNWQVKGNTNWSNGRFLTLSTTTKNLMVAGNFTDVTGNYTINFPHTGTWTDCLTGEKVEVSAPVKSLSLPAHEVRVLIDF